MDRRWSWKQRSASKICSYRRASESERQNMRLLVAEDHPKLARSIANGLREEGYSVDLTFDGSEAAHMLSSNSYDCVILDIMLPGKEGWDVLNDARGQGNRAPVLCLTARDAPED